MELRIPWGSGDFGEHVPDVHQRRRTFRMVFSYLVTRGWIFFYIILLLCENSNNQSINPHTIPGVRQYFASVPLEGFRGG